jgi:hypothetical protein
MKTRQISVFVENKQGRLYEVMKILGDNQINIRALSLADTSDFGIIRLIVNAPDKALKILRDNNFSVGINEVLGIVVPDVAGGLAGLLAVFADSGISVEYMYAFVNSPEDNAIMVFRLDDTEKAVEALKKKNIKIMKESELINL